MAFTDVSNERSKPITGSGQRSTLSIGMVLVIVISVLASACSGGTENGSTNTKGKANESANRVADPKLCPVKALDDAQGPVEITVWHAFDALTKQALEKIAADYNASQQKVKVNVEAQGRPAELFKKYSDRLADPSMLPDVVFGQDTNLRFLMDSGTVVAAEDCIAADPDSNDFYDELIPVVRRTYSIEDTLWPSAFAAVIPLSIINKNHLTRAGLDPNMQIGTLEDLREVAEKIKAANLPGMEAPIITMLDAQYFENWITGAGTEIVNERNGHDGLATKSNFDNPSTRKLLEWMQSMQADGLLKALPYAATVDHYLAFANQTSSILIALSRAVTSAVALANNTATSQGLGVGDVGSELQGLDVGVIPISGLKDAGQVSVNGYAGYLTAGDDDVKVAAAWDFLQFFNSDASQAQWTMMGSLLPVTKRVKDLPEMVTYFTEDPAGKLLGDATQQMNDVPEDVLGPVIGPYDRFRSDLQAMLPQVVNDGKDINTAVVDMDKSFQAMLDEYANEVSG